MATPAAAPIPDHVPETARLYAAHEAAATYYRAQLPRNEGPCDYLHHRGLGTLVDRGSPWQVGFAPRLWTALTDHLHRHGFTTDELLAAGLAVRGRDGRIRDLLRGRIVFPIRDPAGHTIAFIGRVWTERAAADPATPKYLNTPGTAIYAKGQHLFGLYEQRDRIAAGWPPVLVEGPADSIAVWLSYARTGRTGRTGLVGLAPCGTSLTAAQVQVAVDLSGARRYGLAVAFDGDEAGRKAADRAYQLLADQPGILARAAVFAPDADPADLIRHPHGRALLRTTLERRAQPLLHLVLEHRIDTLLQRFPRTLHEVEGRLALARSLAPLVGEQPPQRAVAALRHIAAHVQRLTTGQLDSDQQVADTMRCIVTAVSEHLETTPAQALPARSAPEPPTPHPSATAFPTPPHPGLSGAVVPTPIATDRPSANVARHRSR